MDVKKRRTNLRHMCKQCYRSYSRLWVLKRHLVQQHGIQHLGDSFSIPLRRQSAFPKDFQNFMSIMMAHDLTVKERPVQTRPELYQDAMRLARIIIKPIYDAIELAIQNYRAYFQKWTELYFPFPKSLISGFSCYLCFDCLATEPPIPVTERGFDPTGEGRHHCQIAHSNSIPLTSDKKSKINQLASQVFNDLSHCIDLWIPGKRLILANKIFIPNSEHENSARNYIEKRYDIPNKYHLEDADFVRSPWLLRLLRGGRIEPTPEQLTDFCAYCVGTYGIFRTLRADSFQYYAAFLASAESIEKPDSSRPNDSLWKK